MRYPLPVLFLLSAALLISCSTTRQTVEIVKEVSRDTIYLNRIQYDSIYIQHEKIYEPVDTSASTLPPFKGGPGRVLESHIEYRYKLLRDTVRIHQIDTIPAIREVEVIKTERYTPWYTKTLAWIGAFTLFIVIVIVIVKPLTPINHKP